GRGGRTQRAARAAHGPDRSRQASAALQADLARRLAHGTVAGGRGGQAEALDGGVNTPAPLRVTPSRGRVEAHPRSASRYPLKGAHLRTGKAGSSVSLDE